MKRVTSKTEDALQLARQMGTIRPRDLAERGIPRDYLDRLRRRGQIERIGRGLYAWPDADIGEHRSLVEAARQVPRGVICLLSALRFHELTTQSPHEVWIALPPRAWKPRVEYPPLRLVRFSGAAFSEGVERHPIAGVDLPVYGIAKTVADCFKYRNKIGLDVALEALRDCWRRKRCTMDQLWQAAGVCRMTNVMRPYLEALT
jgi:predicted transcriptional regulator of viral defense system